MVRALTKPIWICLAKIRFHIFIPSVIPSTDGAVHFTHWTTINYNNLISITRILSISLWFFVFCFFFSRYALLCFAAFRGRRSCCTYVCALLNSDPATDKMPKVWTPTEYMRSVGIFCALSRSDRRWTVKFSRAHARLLARRCAHVGVY